MLGTRIALLIGCVNSNGVTQMRDLIALFIFLLLLGILLATSSCENSPLNDVDTPSRLQGRVLLQNQADHYGVKIDLIMEGSEISLITAEDGTYTIPPELNPGTWTITAEFPFFAQADTEIEIKNGLPVADPEEMILPQQIRFQVFTDQSQYFFNESVVIDLMVSNDSDQEITLSSDTSPIMAYAIVKDGEILVGSLMPGNGKTPDEIIIPAGGMEAFQAEWSTEATTLEPGIYEVYAILAASASYPDFFRPDAVELNHTLFDKLIPVEIELLP